MNFTDLGQIIAGLGIIGFGAAGLWLAGRDRTADEHTVDDYRPDVDAAEERGWHRGFDAARRYPAPGLHPSRRDWPLLDRQGPRRLRAGALAALEVLPPAPPSVRVSLPLYAEQVVAELMRARYGTTDHAVIAGGFLRDIAAEQQDDGDVIWGAVRSPATDRDLTGAFPVVRAA